MSDEKPAEKDYVVPLGPMAPDRSFPAVRVNGEGVFVGKMVSAVDGVPLGGRDLLSLEPVEGFPAYEAAVLYEGRPASHAGPAMVNSREFRSGWDAVFGAKAGHGAAN